MPITTLQRNLLERPLPRDVRELIRRVGPYAALRHAHNLGVPFAIAYLAHVGRPLRRRT